MSSRQPQLTYYDMSPGVTAFSTTRHGGVSEGSYASLNVNEYCGDTAGHVAANRELLARELGMAADHIIMPHQTHGAETRVVSREFLSQPASVRGMLLEGVDAVLTDVPSLCVGVSTADCIPVLLYDAEHHAAAAIHAGWRGTQARIVHKTLLDMRMAYNTDPARLKAVIGPGISMKNFEVGDEVYDAFRQAAFDMSAIAVKQNKWHIDLPLANKLLLLRNGVREENIQMSGICTFDNVADYFSARRLGIASGRIYTGIIIK